MSNVAGDRAKRIAFVAQSADGLLRDHRKVLEALHARNCEICLLAPNIEPKSAAVFAALGGSYVPFSPEGKRWWSVGIGPEAKKLSKQLADWSADCVVGLGTSWIAFAGPAGRRAKTPRIVSIIDVWPESESAPSGNGRASSNRGLEKALQGSTHVVVHNRHIQRQLSAREMLSDDSELISVPGGGVDLGTVSEQEMPPLSAGVTFSMCAPANRSKGVMTYCNAARALSNAGADSASFRLILQPAIEGDPDDIVTLEDLETYTDLIAVSHLNGPVADEVSKCHVFVYPAQNEGMPRFVLQAMAVGRAVITSDEPGCRETVDERVNGTLVPSGHVAALATAMESYLNRPELIPSMARASRQKAERQFGDTEVVARLLSVFGYNS